MTDRERVISNDYYDLITDYILPQEIRDSLGEYVIQPVSGDLSITYVPRRGLKPAGISNFTYPVLPNMYGLMQEPPGVFDPSPLIKSGIVRVQGETLNLTGSGVVIGFLDTGIRYDYDVFRNPDGSTRILGIWDQTIQSGEPPEGILYGTEYRKEVIDLALKSDNPREIVPSYDEDGHGTSLASVAAGSSLGVGLRFLGAAPEADIVMVKLREAKQYLKDFYLVADEANAYAESDILVALKYLDSYAISLSRPLVICFALGSNMGDHEGHSVMAGFLNQIATRRSRAVVVCGGNEGNSAHHYTATSVEGLKETTENVEIRVGGRGKGFMAELWGSVPATHAISIRTPGGEITPKVDFREQSSREFKFIYDRSRIQIDHVLVEQGSGEELIFFRFINPTPGIWTIQVTISGGGVGNCFHIWLPLKEFLETDTYFLRPSPYQTLTEPSNVREVITVTAYNDANNSFWTESGRGYTRMGRIKPDLCAPGVDIDTILGKKTGTSMSAALTAGACALFLQWAVVEGYQNTVESRELKNYLIRGADRTEGENYPSREWGAYGIIVSG